jgi:hypothetical protein
MHRRLGDGLWTILFSILTVLIYCMLTLIGVGLMYWATG